MSGNEGPKALPSLAELGPPVWASRVEKIAHYLLYDEPFQPTYGARVWTDDSGKFWAAYYFKRLNAAEVTFEELGLLAEQYVKSRQHSWTATAELCEDWGWDYHPDGTVVVVFLINKKEYDYKLMQRILYLMRTVE